MSIDYQRDSQNIVTLVIDSPGKTVNLIDGVFTADLHQALDRIAADEPVAGIILSSAKSSFVAGGDIDAFFQMRDPKEIFEFVEKLRRRSAAWKPLASPSLRP